MSIPPALAVLDLTSLRILSIKLYAWENAFIRKILFVRNDLELKMLRKIGIATVRHIATR